MNARLRSASRMSCAVRGMRSAPGRWLAGAAAIACACVAGCGPERIEYYKRQPGQETGFDSAPIRTADGRTIVFVDRLPSEGPAPESDGLPVGTYMLDEYGKPMSVEQMREHARATGQELPAPSGELVIRERDDSGRITLRAAMPEHVLENFSECIREREYEAIWEQLTSRSSRNAMARDDFVAWCEVNRTELLAFLNRMAAGWNSTDVIADSIGGPQHQRYRLHPRLRKQFSFMRMEIVYEDGGCRLHSVK
jgi:hypothetical protein